MKYKAVFSDIDGTLLNSNHKISNPTKQAVQKINAFGIPFILVSARMPACIIPLQKELGINSPIICFSGSLILGGEAKGGEAKGGERKTIQNITMNPSDVYKLCTIIKHSFKDICITLYQKNVWFVENPENPWVINEGKITNSFPTTINLDSLLTHQLQINKILCMGNPECIDQLSLYLKTFFPKLTINKSKKTYLEITACDVLKSSAIKVLANDLGLQRNEIFAIGDNYNDMDMIAYAGIGIAMGNSPQEVKTIADDITSSNDEDGLKLALQKYF